MPQDEIVSALSKGQTIASLASARGTTVTAIQNAVLNSVQQQLADTVSKGRLTQDQASQVWQSISSGAWIAQLQDIRQYQATSSQTQAMKDALNNLDAQIKSIMQHRGAK
jgi:polyhydroxyalkanoate synthesis regulator phasin